MSILKSDVKNAAVTDPGGPMLTPEQVLDLLRATQPRIPDYVQLPKGKRTSTIFRRASVNIELAREAISAVGASETVQHVIGNSPAEMHAAENEIGRWTAVEAELRAMLRGVTAANLLRRERLGLAALQVLNVSRELVRREEHAGLLPHVEAMSRIPKYTSRRKTKTADPAKPPVVVTNPPGPVTKPPEPAIPAKPA